jgi:hypothetical protein
LFKNILCIILFCIGTYIIWSTQGFLVYVGIFILLWSNNISFMHNIESMRKLEGSNLLKRIFGNNMNQKEIEKIMSQTTKISER